MSIDLFFIKTFSKGIAQNETFFRTNFKLEITNILVLLHRLKGEVEYLNFIDQYLFLVQVIWSDT